MLANSNNQGIVNSYKRLRRLEELQICQVWINGHSVIGRTVDRQFYAWGRNQCSQLGLQSEEDEITTPHKITWFSQQGLFIKDVHQGLNCTLFECVNTSGQQLFYYVGDNDNNTFKLKDKK